MGEQEVLMVRRKEIKRYQIIEKVIKKELKQVEAAEILELSERQIGRVVKRVREEGEAGVIHRLRGQRSHRCIKEDLKGRIIKIYRQRYEGFGPTLASEKLFDLDKIKISKETLRQILIQADLWQIRGGKIRRHLLWRERKDHFGEMIQMDGSHHEWLEGRGPKLVLMGMIDDATGNVYGRFYAYEGTLPAMDVLKRYIDRHGIPTSIYLDRHGAYKAGYKRRYDVDDLWSYETDRKSQFAKACEEIGIELIHAHSPQAKGRIERLFKTFQDRLVKELRLAKVKSLKQANEVLEQFLPKHNQRFAVEAKERGDLHRRVKPEMNVVEALSVRTERRLRNDHTLVHNRDWYQVLTQTRAKKVIVKESLDSPLTIWVKDCQLQYKGIDGPIKRVHIPKPRLTSRRVIPRTDHPWRRFSIKQKPKNRTFLFC